MKLSLNLMQQRRVLTVREYARAQGSSCSSGVLIVFLTSVAFNVRISGLL